MKKIKKATRRISFSKSMSNLNIDTATQSKKSKNKIRTAASTWDVLIESEQHENDHRYLEEQPNSQFEDDIDGDVTLSHDDEGSLRNNAENNKDKINGDIYPIIEPTYQPVYNSLRTTPYQRTPVQGTSQDRRRSVITSPLINGHTLDATSVSADEAGPAHTSCYTTNLASQRSRFTGDSESTSSVTNNEELLSPPHPQPLSFSARNLSAEDINLTPFSSPTQLKDSGNYSKSTKFLLGEDTEAIARRCVCYSIFI